MSGAARAVWVSTLLVLGLLAPACSGQQDPVGIWKYEMPDADGGPSVTVILEIKSDGTWHEDYPATGGYGEGTWEARDGHYELTALNAKTGEPLEWAGGVTVFAYLEEKDGAFVYRVYDDEQVLPLSRASLSDLNGGGTTSSLGSPPVAPSLSPASKPSEVAAEDPLHPSAGYVFENYFGQWFSKVSNGVSTVAKTLKIGPDGCFVTWPGAPEWVDLRCEFNEELGILAMKPKYGEPSQVSLVVLGEGTYGLLQAGGSCQPFDLSCGLLYSQLLS